MTKTLLITGVSTGFGRALSEAALAKGYRVVGTVRNEAAKAAFEALKPGQAFARLLDVTDTAAIVPLTTGGPLGCTGNLPAPGGKPPVDDS